jgi:predicted TIM-barrel fold metal-dependent hydrolase
VKLVKLNRREFIGVLGSAATLGLPGCHASDRYSDADAAALEEQRRAEKRASGTGPYGRQIYRGYRGLAELPYFELDASDDPDQPGTLRCVVEDLPKVLDIHAHLGISLLLAPNLDLQARGERVRHLLDCDATVPGCPLDLDVYINANFTSADLRALKWGVAAQALWGSESAATHTVPNLIAEMDATGVERVVILPIAFGLPFGDRLTERFMEAIDVAGAGERLLKAASVVPGDPEAPDKLRRHAAAGARIVKLHPAMQRFFPDSPELRPIYRACSELGLPVIFHGGRAGIEPEYAHQFTLMRHYEGAFREFPELQFVLGHAGARDVVDAIPLARRYGNVWLGVHGQGVTMLARLIDEVGADRLLFGSDWPFYHLAATLAKILIVTEGRPAARHAILRGNADRLLQL